ncbi:MAG: acetylxylan esterase, partial [Ruminococcus sp.]|nr:acetylxylan esterase [Ruminococcus sp.]
MKLKYRIAAILAAAVTALSLTSCGSPQQSSQQTTAAQTTEPSTAPAAVVDKYKTNDYEVREIWCENDGQKIYGQAFVPKTDGRSPLIITSHGLGANHESGASYAKKYAPKGFAVYTFDFRGGSNKNNENKSDG